VKRSVADLKPGEKGIISSFADKHLLPKLLEMGCLPGSEVMMKFSAPLGDPVAVDVSGYTLSLRLQEASLIQIS